MNNETIRIFISYSHEKDIWLTEYLDTRKVKKNPKYLLDFWKRNLGDKNVEFWHDREEKQGIRASDQWRKKIFEEIDKADIAILLITQDFVTSSFIKGEELPYIINRSNEGKIEVLPILLEPARWKNLEMISTYQLTPGKPTPLSEYFEISENEWLKVRLEVVEAIEYVIAKVERKRQRTRIEEEPEKKGKDIRKGDERKPEDLARRDEGIHPPQDPGTESNSTPAQLETGEHKPSAETESKEQSHSSLSVLRSAVESLESPSAKSQFVYLLGSRRLVIDRESKKEVDPTYIAGSAFEYTRKEENHGGWYLLRVNKNKEMWLKQEYGSLDDKRAFFQIEGQSKVGYLVHGTSSEDITRFCELENIPVDDSSLGRFNTKTDQIARITIGSEDNTPILTVMTTDGCSYSKIFDKKEVYWWKTDYHLVCPDFYVRLTGEKEISLVRLDKRGLNFPPEEIITDTAQRRLRIKGRPIIGYLDGRGSNYFGFTDIHLGNITLKLSRIERIQVDAGRKESPVIIETFDKNTFAGKTIMSFVSDGITIRLDDAKELVLEPL